VARALDELPELTPVVVDPVMIAESGARLLDADAERVLAKEIMPRASVLTPNVPEARALAAYAGGGAGAGAGAAGKLTGAGEGPKDPAGEDAEARELADALLSHRARAVDLFADAAHSGAGSVEITGERHADGAAHGSGCTHSSVLAAQLALGREPLEAARIARVLTGEAVARGLREIGGGAGPVDVIGLAADARR
jgi:hydroxymethylpyrimidine/phosphomethylpyrimidine kinase